MIKEDYVSFETAKLLKEKGFDESCECFYDTENNDASIVNGWMDISNSELEEREFVCYSAPTLQMAMKWLREEKKLYVNVWADPKDAENNDFRTIFRTHVYDGTSNYGESEFFTYEEACESSIKYCLENLI